MTGKFFKTFFELIDKSKFIGKKKMKRTKSM